MAERPGTCVVSRLADGAIRIEQADPVIWVSAQLLEEVNQPCSEARHPAGKPSSCLCGQAFYGDGILTIQAANGTVSYGIGSPASTIEPAFIAHRSGGDGPPT